MQAAQKYIGQSEVVALDMTIIAQIFGYVISGLVALVVASMQHNKTTALIEYRLKELEAKVDKHNNLVERMTAVETQIKLIK